MIRDIRTMPADLRIEVDLCIIGAGAAGIAIAREFVGTSTTVALLESGGYEFEPEVQALYEGDSVGEQYYRELDACRTRRFGGSTNCWGGMCTPMTEIDFRPRSWVPYSGWPISYREFEPYLHRAHKLCGVGPYAYDEQAWDIMGSSTLPFDPEVLWSHVWQINNRRGERQVRFAQKFRGDLNDAPNVTVYLHANVTKLVTDEYGRRVESARLQTLDGRRGRVRAKVFVLACGGIENARMLLVSNDRQAHGIGNDHDLVGRFFNEHLHAPCATVEVEAGSSPIANYSRLWRLGRSHALPGITLSPKMQERCRTLNASLSIDPVFGSEHAWTVVKRVREDLRRKKLSGRTLSNLTRLLRASHVLLPDVYRRLAHGTRPAGDPGTYTLYARAEQAPNPDSRIFLGDEVDRLGVRKTIMDWRTSPIDRRAFEVLTDAAKSEFARLGLGRVKPTEWLRDGGWPTSLEGGPHHMCTTRMSDDPRSGVVDRDARVHGMHGLFVAGSSVFATGGHANCTLTLLATTLRLADYLKSVLAQRVEVEVDQREAALAY